MGFCFLGIVIVAEVLLNIYIYILYNYIVLYINVRYYYMITTTTTIVHYYYYTYLLIYLQYSYLYINALRPRRLLDVNESLCWDDWLRTSDLYTH